METGKLVTRVYEEEGTAPRLTRECSKYSVHLDPNPSHPGFNTFVSAAAASESPADRYPLGEQVLSPGWGLGVTGLAPHSWLPVQLRLLPHHHLAALFDSP